MKKENALKIALYTIGTIGCFIIVGAAWIESMPGEQISYPVQVAALVASIVAPSAPIISHIATPEAVRGVYITACTASLPHLRERVLTTIASTSINAMVVDIKDYSGTISYTSSIPNAPHGKGCHISDLPEFLKELHEKGIYAIARVTVFQDPLYASIHPEIAVQSISRPGHPWADKNGLAFIDPNFPEYWDYIVSISKEAHEMGFDEINFDYVRFPTDGDMQDAQFAIPPGGTRAGSLKNFFSYLHEQLEPLGIVTSADLFGQTTIARDDMGIGQILENALPYFDYIAPMVYPSHFAPDFMGFHKPATAPYDIVKGTMQTAVVRAVAASSTPSKLRPWLQAFDYGAIYTPEMVKLEMQAVTDAGLNSWLLWDASNRYNREAL